MFRLNPMRFLKHPCWLRRRLFMENTSHFRMPRISSSFRHVGQIASSKKPFDKQVLVFLVDSVVTVFSAARHAHSFTVIATATTAALGVTLTGFGLNPHIEHKNIKIDFDNDVPLLVL